MNSKFARIAATLLAGLAGLSLSAQSFTVKGVVTDAVGPVIGATVIEQGTTNGVSTGLDGEYVLSVSSKDAIVEISCIGYATQSFAASAVPATVVLSEDAQFLDDVVVIGYGTVKKSDMTGSVTAINAEEINRGAVTSPSSMLTGKVSGVLITPASGQPGASSTIRVRGAASLSANNDPLIVIDGVPITSDGGAGMGDPLASVNPNDIESFSILKDASATAIYGSRASNGVIIITTKKGKGNGIHVSYDSSYSVKQNTGTIGMMTGDELVSYLSEHRPAAVEFLSIESDGTASNNTDWQKQIYRLAFNTDQNVSVYGGGKFPFRASIGYNLDQATLKTGDNQRVNADVSLSPKFFEDHLSINANAKGIFQSTNWANDGAVGNALAFDPTKPLYFRDAEGNIDKSIISNGLWNWTDASGAANSMASVNPLSNLYDYTNRSHTYRGIGNIQLDYKVHGFEDLRANLNLGIDVAKTQGEKYNQLGSISSKRESIDRYYTYENFNLNSLLEAYLDYNHEFSWCNLDVMGGYSWQHNKVSYDEGQFYNMETRGLEEDRYQVIPNNSKEYYLVSFFGRINYSVLSRYLFTLTFREDASSRFSPKNRWGFFPSAAFAWNAKNESFLKDASAVSALKLRLGWGRTGQQDIGSDYYPYLARYIASSNVGTMMNMGDGYITTLGPTAYNPNLKWETTETYNVGVDFGFINDRVTGTVEAYYRNTFDLLNNIDTPLGSNFGNSVISNIGNMMNRGVELSLNVVPVETEDWHWSIGGNMTFQETRITKLTNDDNAAGYLGVTTGAGMGGTGGYTSLHRAGYSPYTFYLFQQAYDSEGKPLENVLIDRDDDGKITDADRYMTGCSPTPWMYYGLNTQVRYKNWDFGINGHGSVGNYALNKVAMGYSTSYSEDYTKSYVNNLSSDFLIKGWDTPIDNNQKYSDIYLENASFFKIDDINLGYTFNLKNNMRLRLAGSVQNVCTFTKYSGLDPELTAADGVDSNFIPRPRLYTLRLNFNF